MAGREESPEDRVARWILASYEPGEAVEYAGYLGLVLQP